MAAQLPKNTKIISIEKDPDAAWIAHNIHKHAGVANRIKIVVDSTGHAIPRLSQKYRIRSFDFIFIDHNSSNYLRDFMLLEQFGSIRSGTMIVADNVITPGAPDYLNYVRNNRNYKSKTYESTLEYRDDVPDGVEISIRN
jgi:catechol O-methyltransferase